MNRKVTALARGLAAALTLAAGAATAHADVVTLRDGTTYEGTVVSQTRRSVTIDTYVNRVRSTITIEMWRVRQVTEDDATKIDRLIAAEKGEDADDTGAATTTDSTPTAGKAARDVMPVTARHDGYAYVLEVPLKGTFGEHVYPKPVAACLEWAVANGVTDVVFRINSPGGEVWAAQKIVEIMRRYEDKLKYHMLIESAISASIWPTFNCHTISMAPGADFGGAVVFSQTDSGDTRVDEKITSIYAAKLGTSAEAKGYSAALSRAMMIKEAEVYAYRREGSRGEWQITGDAAIAKAPGNEFEMIDGPDTILTLTTKQAAKFGIVDELPSRELDDLCEALDLGPYDNAGDIGFKLSEEWGEKSDRMRDQILTTTKALFAEYARAFGSNDLATVGGAVRNGRKELARLRRLLNDAQGLEMETIVESFEDLDLDEFQDDFERRARDVKTARHRP